MCCQSLRQKTTQKENVKLHFVQYVGCTYIPLFITIEIHYFLYILAVVVSLTACRQILLSVVKTMK